MNRHDLKEQLQHDPFKDSVAKAVEFTSENREKVIQWSIAGVVVLIVIGAFAWYSSYRSSGRKQDLENAFVVLAAQVGPPNQFGKTYSTEEAKKQASFKALYDVIAKDGNSKEGLIARYYLGTMKANSDPKGAESDLKTVADSSSECAPLAKIALSQLYAGENRTADAQQILRDLVDHPSRLVSKDQAQILLAQLEQTTNPRDAKKILQSLKGPNVDPMVARAADQVAAQASK